MSQTPEQKSSWFDKIVALGGIAVLPAVVVGAVWIGGLQERVRSVESQVQPERFDMLAAKAVAEQTQKLNERKAKALEAAESRIAKIDGELETMKRELRLEFN